MGDVINSNGIVARIILKNLKNSRVVRKEIN